MINREAFFANARHRPFGGHMTESQTDGISKILDEWERRELTDPRWLAYMLGTVFHETWQQMRPIQESGSEEYLRSKPYYPYIGEGLIQVTWRANYLKFGAKNPGDLLTWPLALRALFDGMTKGLFTGVRLSEFFNDKNSLWLSARKIINGMDRAELVAGYAREFYDAIKAASKRAPIRTS